MIDTTLLTVWEFKVKEHGIAWEDTIIMFHTQYPMSYLGAVTIAERISQSMNKEVRFNRVDSLQGHYVYKGGAITVNYSDILLDDYSI